MADIHYPKYFPREGLARLAMRQRITLAACAQRVPVTECGDMGITCPDCRAWLRQEAAAYLELARVASGRDTDAARRAVMTWTDCANSTMRALGVRS